MSYKGDSTHFRRESAERNTDRAMCHCASIEIHDSILGEVSDQREWRLPDLLGTRFEEVIRVESFLLEMSSGVSSPRNAIT
jgi:hypothetical protein